MSLIEGTEPLLSVRDLRVDVTGAREPFRVLDDVSFDLYPGETLSIVGESGSGKSMTLRSVLGLLPPGISVTSGSVRLGGAELVDAPARELQKVRGGRIGMIFQDPMTALNPVMTIGEQIDESLKRHSRQLDRSARRKRIVELLDSVRIPNAADRARQYPHEFSGGMRQRAMIAIAMANSPGVLLADEPTTALDVTVQAQILELLKDLQQESGMALILITHDLGVVAEIADRAAVMYAGRIVEAGPVEDLFHSPAHPYLRGLLDSRPSTSMQGGELKAIPGQPPNPAHLPQGCAYRPRCDRYQGRAECETVPTLAAVAPQHQAACHFAAESVLLPDPRSRVG